MFKNFLLALVAVILLAPTAQATTVDITWARVGISSVSSGGTLSPDINLSTTSGLHLNDASIYADNSKHAPTSAPKNGTYGNNYLDVFSHGSATFNLPGNSNSFGLTWAAINPNNTLILTDANGYKLDVTGAEIENYLSKISACSCQADVIITDPFANIVKAQLVTSGRSIFEAANFTVSAVPLPPAAVLFALALISLGFVGYRRRQTA